MREVLGGGSGGRYYADGEDTIHVVPDSRNLPTEFTESRFPFLVERLGLAVDSGGAGRYAGGLGYEKHVRMLRDAHFMSIADRSILACWGVKGGRAGASVPGDRRPGWGPGAEVDAWPTPNRCGPVRSSGSVRRVAAAGATRWTVRWPRSSRTSSGAR
jgi:N-methylhydantoinase B